MNKKIVLEISVDRLNEKGAGAFEQILIVLHKILEKKPGFFARVFKGKKIKRPIFSLEIAKLGKKIRFFIITTSEYNNFIKNQIFAHYSNVEIIEVDDYFESIDDEKILIAKIKQEKHFLFPIKTYTEIQDSSVGDTVDPYSGITSALNKVSKDGTHIFQVNFSPIWDNSWKKTSEVKYKILISKFPKIIKNLLVSNKFIYIRYLFFPFIILKFIINLFIGKDFEKKEEKEESISEYFKHKISSFGYGTNIKLVYVGSDKIGGKISLKELSSTLGVYHLDTQNGFKIDKIVDSKEEIDKLKNRICSDCIILNSKELSGLVHFPTTYVKTPSINWVKARMLEPPSDLKVITKNTPELSPVGESNFRGEKIPFGIAPNDRRRHLYIVGKTGMGKSTLLENMIIDDMRNGRGVAVIDPHGDLAETVIGFIPKNRTNSAIIFDPSDTKFPISLNMLENVKPEHRSLVASGLVGIFKKIFGDSWGPRLEHILRNTILALLEYPNSTLISIPLMLTSESFRKKVISKIKDPIVKKFWTGEFEQMQPKQQVEASGPILNKVGQFLSSSILRNILGQPKNSFDLRWAMDNKKIVIVNLSKGRIGEDASSLLGSMMVTKFQIDAMSRADIPEKDRVDFYLYVDEFQNFATDSFATILSEARKYKLNLIMANQYIDQMSETVRGAVFGNVGSTAAFQVGYHDAAILKDVMSGDITTDDLINLRKYSVYLKLLIDGMPSKVFSVDTFAPYSTDPEAFRIRYEKILKVSREKYATNVKFVESRINSTLHEIEKMEKEFIQKKADFKKRKEEEKKKLNEAKMKKKQEENLKKQQEALKAALKN